MSSIGEKLIGQITSRMAKRNSLSAAPRRSKRPKSYMDAYKGQLKSAKKRRMKEAAEYQKTAKKKAAVAKKRKENEAIRDRIHNHPNRKK